MASVKVRETGFFGEHGSKRLVLLKEGDEGKLVRSTGDLILCEVTCRNSNRLVVAEIELENVQH